MPWMETCAVDQRMRLVMAGELGEEPFAALCRRFGVSRRVGYKWLSRYRAQGVEGLADRSRAPDRRPQSLSEAIAEACLEIRREHPTWGPAKVREVLRRRRRPAPAASTIGLLFDREGLTVKRRLRRRAPPASHPFGACVAPNDTWCVDFKGWFRLGDGARCEPLTLIDAASRYLLRCQALERTDGEHVWPVLDAAFREFGLPCRLRSDNGPPFASVGAGGLSRMAVKLVKAGVIPERIQPGRPQQNGRLERLHRTLKEDAASPPKATLAEQQRAFDVFRAVYNHERPHEALDFATPASLYCASPRAYPCALREPDYPDEAAVRRVRTNGCIKWAGDLVFVSEALIGEPVAVEETEEGERLVRYGAVELGFIDKNGRLRRRKLEKPRRACGLVDNAARCPQGPQERQPQQQPAT